MSIVRALADSWQDPARRRGATVLVLVGGLSIGIAVLGALLIGRDHEIDRVNGLVEFLSGSSSSFLGGLVRASFLFAFAAGMASAVNPCGFAMLPAYLGLYLGAAAEEDQAGPVRQLGQSLLVGASVTAGFVVLFGLAGVAIGLGASFLTGVVPWLGLVIGVLLALTGAWLLGGGKLYTGLAARAASHIGEPSQVNVKGYFLFGISYGTASLSCTLPIFLGVLGISVAGATAWSVLGNFLLFALGMGLVILALTLGMAFFRGTMVGAVRRALPYIQPIGSWLMVLAGTYIIFYWLTIGGLL